MTRSMLFAVLLLLGQTSALSLPSISKHKDSGISVGSVGSVGSVAPHLPLLNAPLPLHPRGGATTPTPSLSLPPSFLGTEFLGTTLLVFLGASINLASAPLLPTAALWGVLVFFLINVVGTAGPAHFNPAVTIVDLLRNKDRTISSARNLIATQVLGGTVGAVAYLLFNPSAPLRSIISSPAPSISLPAAFLAEALGTATIAFAAFNKNLNKNLEPNHQRKPLIVAIAVTFGIIIAGVPTGAGLNPAREGGPRIAAVLLGRAKFGDVVSWTKGAVYFVAPVVGAIVGAAIGGGL